MTQKSEWRMKLKSEAKFGAKSEAKIKNISEQKIKHKSKRSRSAASTLLSSKSLTFAYHDLENELDDQVRPPNYMSSMTLLLPEEIPDCPEVNPPPSTPEGDFDFGFTFRRLPKTFRDLEQLEVPIVRNVGIKSCIASLGAYFDCSDYEFNFLHFWFLDVVTDCIWRAQDQYEFPEEQQKIVLSWFLFFLDVIRGMQ